MSFKKGQIIVTFKSVEGINKKEIVESLGGELLYEYIAIRVCLVKVPEGEEERYIKKFEADKSIEYVELDFLVEPV